MEGEGEDGEKGGKKRWVLGVVYPNPGVNLCISRKYLKNLRNSRNYTIFSFCVKFSAVQL